MHKALAHLQFKEGWTVEETALWSGVGRTKLFSEMKARRLLARKCGARTIIPREEALRWFSSLPNVKA